MLCVTRVNLLPILYKKKWCFVRGWSFYFRIKYHTYCTMLCFFDSHELMNHSHAYFIKVTSYTLSAVPSYNHRSWAYDIKMFIVIYIHKVY